MSDKIGNMILKFRKQKGIRQKELAEIAGINRMSIGNYERGTRTPSAEVLNKIADALEVPITDLLGTSETFESDFKVSELGEIVEDYIMDWRNIINEAFKGKYFSNTDIVRNLLIDMKAKDDARNQMKMPPEQNKSILFMTADDKPLDPEFLYKTLKEKYIESIRNERRKELTSTIHEADRVISSGQELPNHLKNAVLEFYEDSSIGRIPPQFKKYFQDKIDQHEKYKEMKRQNDEALGLDKEELKKLRTMEKVEDSKTK